MKWFLLIKKYGHSFVIFTILAVMLIKSLFRFSHRDYDYLWYHLPGALIHAGKTTLTPSNYISEILDGFPPLANYIQGVLITLFDRPSASSGLNAIAVLICLSLTKWMFGSRLKLNWYFTAFLAFPLLVMQFYSGYIDLWVGSWLALCFAALTYFIIEKPNMKSLLCLSIGIWAAALSKYQAWPFVGFFVGVAVLIFIHRLVKTSDRNWKAYSLVTVILILGATIWPMRNIYKFNNPTFPVAPPLVGKYFSEGQDTGRSRFKVQIPEHLWSQSAPSLYLLSNLEVTRFTHPDGVFEWKTDMGDIRGYQGAHHRMGGLFFLSVLLTIIYIVWLTYKKRLPIPITVLLLLTACIASVMPQSHELRYWLVVPLSAIFLITLYGFSQNKKTDVFMKISFFLIACYVLPKLHALDFKIKDPRVHAPAAAMEFWKIAAKDPDKVYCKSGLGHQAIYWAGPNFNSFKVLDDNCEKEQQMRKCDFSGLTKLRKEQLKPLFNCR